MNENTKAIISYRINKAKETIEEARVLSETEHWNSVANRLYYSSFYIVNALLLKKNIIVKTHEGVKILFFKEFIRTGLLPSSMSEFYQKLFDLRTEGDYEDLIILDGKEVEPLIKETKNFVEIIEKYIETI